MSAESEFHPAEGWWYEVSIKQKERIERLEEAILEHKAKADSTLILHWDHSDRDLELWKIIH